MSGTRLRRAMRSLRAMIAAAGIFYLVSVTAGSNSAAAAAAALKAAAPKGMLRWELGDLGTQDALSGAVVLTIGESPLLLSARGEVAKLWSAEEEPPLADNPVEELPSVVVPVEETPVESMPETDNGVPARTLIPSGTEGYTVNGLVYLSNTTGYVLSPQDLEGNFAAKADDGDPQILIVHTHGSEGYTPVEGTEVVWSGDHRTTDCRYNVVGVGDVIADVLGAAGFSVLHDRTLYDYPSYNGAYDRSLSAIERYLEQYPSIRFVLDVHRDAIEDSSGNQYKVVTEDGSAAQMTLVLGSDGSGLSHPNWRENVKLAAALQQRLLEETPSLMRPMLLRNSRYNQHATTGSLLIEVGAAGNSPAEAAAAARLFAQGMVDVLAE